MRYKGPGSKKAILACIERKGKKLGCSGAKDETLEEGGIIEDTQVTINEIKALTVEDLMINEAMKELILQKDGKITKLEKDISTLQSQLDAEKSKVADYEQKVKDEETVKKTSVVDSICEIKRTIGQEVTDETKKSLLSKTCENLEDILNTLKESVGMSLTQTETPITKKPVSGDGHIPVPEWQRNLALKSEGGALKL